MRYCIHNVWENEACAKCDAADRKLRSDEANKIADLRIEVASLRVLLKANRKLVDEAKGLLEEFEAKAFHAREDANAWSAIAIRYENDAIRLQKVILEINDLESAARSGDAAALLEAEAKKARIELKLPTIKKDIIGRRP